MNSSDDGTGRHKGLKIPCLCGVRVRVPLRALGMVALVLSTSGCFTSLLAYDGRVRPAWVNNVNPEHPDFYYVVGHCEGFVDRSEAVLCAVQQGKAQLATFGVAGGTVLDTYSEETFTWRRTRGAMVPGPNIDIWVWMAYPRKAM